MNLLSTTFCSKIALAIMVLAIGAYPLVGLISVVLSIGNSTPVAVGYRAIYLFLSVYLLLTLFPRREKTSFSWGLVGIIVFWVVYLLRMIYELEILGFSKGYASKGLVFYVAYGIGGCFIPAVAISLSQHKLDHKQIINWLIGIFLISNLAMITFLFVNQGFNISILYSRLRLGEDSVISPIALSQYGGALIVLLVGKLLLSDKKATYILAPMVLVGITSLIMGASRGPLLVTIIVVGLILFDHLIRSVKKVSYWLGFFLCFIVGMYMLLTFIIPNIEDFAVFNRVSQTIETGNGLDARAIQWSAAWSQFKSNPIWGNGIVEQRFNFYPHNMVLEVLMATGLIGGLAVLYSLWFMFIRFINRSHFSREKMLYFYLFFLFWGCSLFSLALITIPQVWILLGLIVSLKYDHVGAGIKLKA